MLQLILFLVLLINKSSTFVFKPGPLIPPTKGQIWPKVQHEDKSDNFFTVQPSFFQFEITGSSCDTLENALDRYRHLIIFNSRRIKEVYYEIKTCYEDADPYFLGYLTRLQVQLDGPCNDEEYPSITMQEEYVLNVTDTVQKLTSGTIWGILRGLESFSQLIYMSDDHSCHRINTTSIHDYPRFPHRGLLLDTSRHYHTKDNILRLLDAMSYNKFNVFHWHITDDYSFPYVSKRFPELSTKGAFHPTLMVYEPEFIQEVQEYARKRGIRVLAELGTPGHTLSWGLGNPDLLTACYDVPMLEWGPVDPTKNSTYVFMYDLLDELKETFKDQYIHLGGDEVDYSCWISNPDVSRFMEKNGVENYAALQSLYTQKIIDHVDSLGLYPIVWEEVFMNGENLPAHTVVQVWTNFTEEDDHPLPREILQNVTEAGHHAILSSYWYLNLVNTGGDWLKFYNFDPLDFEGSDEQKKLVLGGEACMWSEVVDENNLEPRMWPRGSVAAEKFWSASDQVRWDMLEAWPVAERLEEHTCRMKRRGVKAQPAAGPSVCF